MTDRDAVRYARADVCEAYRLLNNAFQVFVEARDIAEYSDKDTNNAVLYGSDAGALQAVLGALQGYVNNNAVDDTLHEWEVYDTAEEDNE